MRILIVVPADEKVGGVASVVGNLARYLQSRNHEVIFLFPGDSPFLRPKVTKWGFQGFELRMQPPLSMRHPLLSLAAFLILFPFTMYQLIRFIHKYNIQLVNVHYPVDAFFYFSICRHIQAIKLIISVHGADVLPNGYPKHYYSIALRALLAASDKIIAVSQAFQTDVLEIFPGLYSKICCIHNSVDLKELSESPESAASNELDPYILCIAMHNEKKALDVLIRATRLIQNSDPCLKVVLIGNGPLHQQLKDLARSLDIHQRIVFLGLQGRAEVIKLLHQCRLFVLPSRSEPFGIAIIEALGCRKPVVATAVGGIPEIIEHAKTGILVAPDDPAALADALSLVLRDEDLQRKLAENGYATVRERFSCEHTGAAYEAVYLDALGSPHLSCV